MSKPSDGGADMSGFSNWVGILLSATALLLLGYKYMPHRGMPPGYTLQTDGAHWRFIACQEDYCFTNCISHESRSSAVDEAWKLYKFNRKTHEWRDVK